MNDILEILNKKYLTTLQNYNHISKNKCFYGFSKKFNTRIFVKYFTRENKYINELKLLKIIRPDIVLDCFIYHEYYVICYKYIDMIEVTSMDKESLYNYGRLIGRFHKLFTKEFSNKVVNVDLFYDIDRKINKIKSIEEFDKINLVYNKFLKNKEEYEKEYYEIPKKVLHGDFGLRNIKLINDNLELIDFEYVRENIAYYEFVKFFKQNNIVGEDKESFIKGYNSVYKLDIPSELLIKVIEFDVALGIYSYTMAIEDYDFKRLADKIIENIELFLNKEI